MIRFQIREALKPKDNLVKNVNSYFEKLPELDFLAEFFKKYHHAFHIKSTHACLRGLQESLKGELSQEQEQEQAQEQKQEIEKEQFEDERVASPILILPLKNNHEFYITQPMINAWEEQYPNLAILSVLESIKEWNIHNPEKRKTESRIMQHIDTWLSKEYEKVIKPVNVKKNNHSLFNFNQSVADEWLKDESINIANEVH